MRRVIYILFLLSALSRCGAQMIVTNEVDGTFDTASYGTPPYSLWSDYFASYFYDMYPQYTNHIYDTSRSGSSWNLDFTAQEEKWDLPLWASFPVPGNDWVLANDNGSYHSNDVVQWGTNLFNAPPLFWNGTAVTNEGVATKGITHYALGCIQEDTPDGDGGFAISRNAGSMYLDRLYGTPVVDMWHMLWTNGVSTDITNNRLFGFYPGGHPYPAGHLCMTLKALLALGVDTNVGSMTLDWSNHIIASTNRCTVTDPSLLSGGVLTFTVHFDRMPLAWDVPDGTVTNDARNAFVLMPDLGNSFHWTLQVTNLSAGAYSISVDGVPTDWASGAQLAAGRNWFTNYNGPLWRQRVAVLNAKRDQEDVDHVTLLPTHNAGSPGVLSGVGDLLNFESNGAQQYDQLGKRGTNYINSMTMWVGYLQQYDLAIHNAAQQTNHIITITKTLNNLSPPKNLRAVE
jgi:hypothetical protein